MGASSSSFPGISRPGWEPYVIPQQSGQFDLCIELAESERGLSGYFEYKDQLFDPDRVAQMQEHFVRLLQGFVSDPAAHIGELPLLSEAERRDTVLAWGHPREPASALSCLHRQIEAQAQRTPDAIAVQQAGQTLTYRELDETGESRGPLSPPAGSRSRGGRRAMSRTVAQFDRRPARHFEIGRGLPAVGRRLSHRPVGIHAAGQPGPGSGHPAGSTGTSAGDEPHTICLDSEWDQIARCPDSVIEGADALDNLAYVIYTSGSTGHPKGVMVEHRSIANYVERYHRYRRVDGTMTGYCNSHR